MLPDPSNSKVLSSKWTICWCPIWQGSKSLWSAFIFFSSFLCTYIEPTEARHSWGCSHSLPHQCFNAGLDHSEHCASVSPAGCLTQAAAHRLDIIFMVGSNIVRPDHVISHVCLSSNCVVCCVQWTRNKPLWSQCTNPDAFTSSMALFSPQRSPRHPTIDTGSHWQGTCEQNHVTVKWHVCTECTGQSVWRTWTSSTQTNKLENDAYHYELLLWNHS